VAVLKEGGFLQQVDTPRNLYDKPRNAFVAGFIGSPAMNLVKVPVVDGGVKLGNIVAHLSDGASSAVKQAGLREVIFGVRPESFRASTDGNGLQLKANLVEELGADAYVYGDLPGAAMEKQFVARFDGRTPPRIGDTVSLEYRSGEEHVFNAESGERLG
jgi:multiple sugar transport system ATP-binding protein